jgi:hydroxymethylbilane synthase
VASALAAHHARLVIEVVLIESDGDREPDLPLELMEGMGWFTASLERALLDGRIDLAVHSHKDLPVAASPALVVAAIPPRGSVEDTLCSRDGARLDDLSPGARVGTSSLRRMAQLLSRRPDLACVSIRGNVPSRLRQMHRGDLDAVVLARAGLERMGLSAAASEVFPAGAFLPAPAQGALALQTRGGDAALRQVLSVLDHAPTRAAVTAERAVLQSLHGGCAAPVGAHATATRGVLTLLAGVFAADGTRSITIRMEGDDPAALGRAAGDALLDRGASPLLAAARESLGRSGVP